MSARLAVVAEINWDIQSRSVDTAAACVYIYIHEYEYLTLVMLNKLTCHAHFQFSANQIT